MALNVLFRVHLQNQNQQKNDELDVGYFIVYLKYLSFQCLCLNNYQYLNVDLAWDDDLKQY